MPPPVPQQPQYPVEPQPINPAPSPVTPSDAQQFAQVPQQPVTSGVFGAPQQTPIAPQPSNKSKVSKKLIILISSIVGGLIVLGAAAWLAITLITNNSMALKVYEGDGYSLLVPEKYEQKKIGTSVSFRSLDEKSSEQSGVQVSVGSIPKSLRDKYIEIVDESLNEESLTKYSGSGTEISDFKIDNVKQDGQEARKLTATVKEDGKTTGTLYMIVIFGEEKAYTVTIAAHISEPALAAKSGEIISSFDIK